jgi:hypothetical protein
VPTPNDLLSILVTWGPGGIVLGLILTGQLEPKRFRELVSQDRDSWKDAFVKEQEAHQLTRQALAKAEERADASLEAAKTTAQLLEDLDHRRNRQRDN